MLGIPAMPEREQKVQFAAIAKLPEMRRHLKALEQAVARLMNEDDKPGNTSNAAA